jgi:hypothetical protein
LSPKTIAVSASYLLGPRHVVDPLQPVNLRRLQDHGAVAEHATQRALSEGEVGDLAKRHHRQPLPDDVDGEHDPLRVDQGTRGQGAVQRDQHRHVERGLQNVPDQQRPVRARPDDSPLGGQDLVIDLEADHAGSLAAWAPAQRNAPSARGTIRGCDCPVRGGPVKPTGAVATPRRGTKVKFSGLVIILAVTR